MAHIHSLQIGSSTYLIEPFVYVAASGTDSAYTATLANYEKVSNSVLFLNVPANNAANVTLAINGETPLPIYYQNSAVDAGALKANQTYALTYDTNKWHVLNNLDGNALLTIDSNGGLENGNDGLKIKSGGIVNGMIANNTIANGKLANSKVIIAGNDVNLGDSLAASTLVTSLGLSKAMRFIGVATVAITDGSTTDPVISGYTFGTNGASATAGDVVIDKDSAYEYVWSTAKKWERLGGDSSYKVVQTAVSNATAETTTATTFVHSVTQDTNGVITVKTRPLPTYNNYSHPTGDGNLHVPATGTSNNGKFLKAGSTAGSISWAALTASDIPDISETYLKVASGIQYYNNHDKNIDTLTTTPYIQTAQKEGGSWSGTKPSGSHNGVALFNFQTHTGNYYSQLALDTSQNRIWMRSANNASSYGTWSKVAYTADIEALDVSNITGFGNTKTLATLTETDGKIAATFQDIAFPVTSVAGKTGAVTLAKGDVGLGNVDNTADANKSVNYATSAGSATTATYIKCTDTRSTALNPTDLTAAQGVRFDFKSKGTINLTATDTYAGVMSFRPYGSNSDWSGGNAHQLAFNSEGLYWRNGGASWGNWHQILDSGNYTDYTVTKTGTGASGSWGISITGTATALTSNAGSTTQPIYFSSGKPTATSYCLETNVKYTYIYPNSTGTWKTIGGREDGKVLMVTRYSSDVPNWVPGNYASSILFGGSDTKGYLGIQYNTPIVSFAGGHIAGATDDNPVWYFKISGTSGKTYTFPEDSKTLCATDGSNASGIWGISISGNAATATAIQTAGTTAQFYRGDNTWSNTLLGPLKIGASDAAANTGYATANVGSQNYIAFYGLYNDGAGSYNHTYIGESIYGSKTTANEQSELLLFHGNDPGSGSGPDRIRLLAGPIDLCVYTAATSGTWDTIRQTAGTKVANFANGQVTITGNLLPEADATYDLGNHATLRWRTAYLTTSLCVSAKNVVNAYNTNGKGSFIGPAVISICQTAAGDGLYIMGASQQYARMYIGTIGTTSAEGYTYLELGNNIAKATNKNAYGILRIYSESTTYTDIRSQAGYSKIFYLPKYNGTMYAIHAGSTSAIGSDTQPIFIAANGRATASTSSVGDAYTPTYLNGGTITEITPVQYVAFTIANGKSGVKLTHAAFTAQSYVLQIVVTSGESNLSSNIAWSSDAGEISLTCTSVTTGVVSGYILVSRGGALTVTSTDLA